MVLYDITHWCCTIIGKVWFSLGAEGLENVPDDGPLILCSNHASNLDPFLVGTVIKTRRLWFMSKAEIYRDNNNRFLLWFYRQMHMFPVKRSGMSKDALKNALALVSSGKALMLFPEGSRTNDGQVNEFKAGSGMIAERSKAVVIPVYIDGSFAAWPRGKIFFRKSPIKVYFGKPVDLTSTLGIKNNRERHHLVTEIIRDRVLSLKNTI